MSSGRSRTARAVVVAVGLMVVALAGLVGCRGGSATGPSRDRVAVVETDDDGFHGTLIDPPLRPADVTLTDTGGRRFTLTQRAPDEVTAVFFGFTSCDDVCPTTIADLATARRQLPTAAADKVRVVFVTVDPARDTPPVLAAWLGQFDPDFIGVTGSVDAVHELERSLYLPESEPEPPTAGHRHAAPGKASSPDSDYDMDHSGAVYLFGPRDQMLLHSGGTTPSQYADDLTHLLQG